MNVRVRDIYMVYYISLHFSKGISVEEPFQASFQNGEMGDISGRSNPLASIAVSLRSSVCVTFSKVKFGLLSRTIGFTVGVGSDNERVRFCSLPSFLNEVERSPANMLLLLSGECWMSVRSLSASDSVILLNQELCSA